MRKQTKCVRGGRMFDETVGGLNASISASASFEYIDRDGLACPGYSNTPNQNSVIPDFGRSGDLISDIEKGFGN